MRSIRSWALFVTISSAVAVLAVPGCGSGGGNSTFPGAGQDGSAGDDSTTGAGDSSRLFGDGGTGDGSHHGCTPRTCAQLHPPVGCGEAGDGCGGVIMCGSCTPPQTCGGGDPEAGVPGKPGQCGGSMGCHPKTCAAYPSGTCGQQPDGCGGLTPDCHVCATGQTCGGGGTANQCGTSTVTCTPKTCAAYPNICGQQSDGCGSLTPNCNPCTAPATCGGGVPDKCGTAPVPDSGADSGNPCVPKTCTAYPGLCGQQSDGCGGLTASCNPCTAPQICGGGGVPDHCGTPACIPKTCTAFPGVCGQQSDGCGGLTANCNPCTAPNTCGGGGTAGVCGNPTMNCTPATCAQTCAAAGIPLAQCCGVFADGCGGLTADCGGCVAPAICGGGGTASECGDSNIPDGSTICTGLCGQIPSCSGGVNTTTVTGRVYAPTNPTLGYGAPDPIQHAHVFIPNDPSTLVAFGTTVACACDTASGPAIASTYSAIDGTFTLTNVPAGNNIPIVIQLGRWRRVYYMNITACVAGQPPGTSGVNSITSDATCRAGGVCNTRLPRHEHEFNNFDNIPLISVVTGSADGMECILPKMGIDATSYSNPGGAGRVQFYQANGAVFSGATPNESALWSSTATLEGYDMVIFDCEGGEATETAAALRNVQTYANAGGRVFATHYSYVWTFTNDPWGCGGEADSFGGNPTPPTATCTTANHTVADWYADQAYPVNDPIRALVDDPTMAAWLAQPLIGIASPLQLAAPRHDTNGAIVPPAKLYLHADPTQSANTPLEFTWNSPPYAPPAQQCGRVLFSDFHVYNNSGATFPGECAVAPLTAQEKVLEFMLFDLGDCVQAITPPPPPTCTPKTCANYPGTCGVQSDGCGGVTPNCGSCPPPQTCGGGGVPGHCGGGCTPKTCADYPGICGQQSDGCGGLTVSCGACTPGCTPETCSNYPSGTCGQQADGCGGLTVDCGNCTPPQTCGGGGVGGMCGAPDSGLICTPACPSGVSCGPAGDGCGGVIQCGTCPSGQTCGGGGVQGQCGTPPACTKKTCASYPSGTCGQQADGCGGLTPDCGTCTPPATCGGGGTPGMCGNPACTPQTCAQTCAAAGITSGCCGQFSDGCGGLTPNCGMCTMPQTCGGGGVANDCGGGAQ